MQQSRGTCDVIELCGSNEVVSFAARTRSKHCFTYFFFPVGIIIHWGSFDHFFLLYFILCWTTPRDQKLLVSSSSSIRVPGLGGNTNWICLPTLLQAYLLWKLKLYRGSRITWWPFWREWTMFKSTWRLPTGSVWNPAGNSVSSNEHEHC